MRVSSTRTGAALRAGVLAVAVSALVGTTVSACSEAAPKATQTQTTPVTAGCAGDAALFACARRSTIGPYVPASPGAASGRPLVLGMVNQENTPAGSYPELSQAVQAAVAFVNHDLGGVGGRPVKVEVCNTGFSAEGSTTCAQQFVEAHVPAVLGGIDVFGNAVDTLARNGIPYLGGIPVSTQSVTDANSFQWSGGTWGAAVAFAQHAATQLHAKRVSIVYGEFGSITDSAKVGQAVLARYGVKAQLVPYPILATDISSALAAAATTKPDAIFVLAADAGCKAGFDGLATLGLHAAKYFVGACASPAIIDQLPTAETDGTYFNVEGPITQAHPDADFAFYSAVIHRYGKGLDPIGAGTVSFRAFMDVYALLRQLADAGKGITAASLTDLIRRQKDAPSFAGHPYTCDGRQFPRLRAMCSPQQVLGQMHDRVLSQVGGWIDVGTISRG